MKHEVLFCLKSNEVKVLMNAVCCSRDWRFKVNDVTLTSNPLGSS